MGIHWHSTPKYSETAHAHTTVPGHGSVPNKGQFPTWNSRFFLPASSWFLFSKAFLLDSDISIIYIYVFIYYLFIYVCLCISSVLSPFKLQTNFEPCSSSTRTACPKAPETVEVHGQHTHTHMVTIWSMRHSKYSRKLRSGQESWIGVETEADWNIYIYICDVDII